ncbi:MAG: recJ [Chloroflexi bacterium]|nr:recJ [Chloroflexota bacterium]
MVNDAGNILSPHSKRWQIAPAAPPTHLQQFSDLPRLVVQILYNRGVTSPNQVADFLNSDPPIRNPLEAPKLKGLDKAVARLRRAIQQREPVAVYGDYDVDGVTATALLTQTLLALSADARPYIPDRVDEGYGLNKEALSKLHGEGVRVVVTVDCGIRSPQEVAFGNDLGLDLIVTDHHSIATDTPPALACINPKQDDCPYPFKDLAGVGLAFKLAQALLLVERRTMGQSPLSDDDLLDLVALGTVADLAPLVDENRALVQRGLARLNAAPRAGIAALMQVAGATSGAVDATTIGYTLGPRLNAAGRIEHAMAAYRLLVTDDAAQARELAAELDQHNRERQRLTRETQDKARELALAGDPTTPLLFAADPNFRAGVVGLAASRLTEEFYRPSIVVELGQVESRGSCRSIPEFHITRALDECAELLIRHGGHAAAAGFTVPTSKLDELAARLQAIAHAQLGGRDLTPTLEIDAEILPGELNRETRDHLKQLEPCGYGNPTPALMSRGMILRDIRSVGADGAHLKLSLMDERRATWDAIGFRQSHHSAWLRRDMRIDVAYHLEVNEWNGQERLQFNILDVRPARDA